MERLQLLGLHLIRIAEAITFILTLSLYNPQWSAWYLFDFLEDD